MENKNPKQNLSESQLLNLKNEIQSSLLGKNNSNQIKKKCKCTQLLGKKSKLKFDEDLPYHIKKRFTKNILLNEKNDKIVLISANEYNKNNKPSNEDKSSNKLPQVNSTKNKTKIDSKNHSQNNVNDEEIDDNNNIKDILNEISEISADLELFEMEKRKRKMMKLIEVMAEKLDNNITDPNELTDLYMFEHKLNY
jgi:hypothetical protein